MSEMRVAGDGLAHARFVAEFFGGPVDGYSASSSDNGVATAGVQLPDLLIVAPVSNGSTSVTVTASGPGGTATQTFTVRVGPQSGIAPGASSAPAPAPSPPPITSPTSDDAEPFIPTEVLPPVDVAPDDPDLVDIPTETLSAVGVTAQPVLVGTIPQQSVAAGQSLVLEIGSYFGGVVQVWSVESSNPTTVSVAINAFGVVTLVGGASGTATITVRAANILGSVAQAFPVSVSDVATSGTAGSDTPAAAPAELTVVGDSPNLALLLGQLKPLDLSNYFSEAATGFDVSYDPTGPDGRVDIRMTGSVAKIRGVQVGTISITLIATAGTARVTRLATIQVTN